MAGFSDAYMCNWAKKNNERAYNSHVCLPQKSSSSSILQNAGLGSLWLCDEKQKGHGAGKGTSARHLFPNCRKFSVVHPGKLNVSHGTHCPIKFSSTGPWYNPLDIGVQSIARSEIMIFIRLLLPTRV